MNPADVKAAISDAVEHWASTLRVPEAVSAISLMRAIADLETRAGERCWATRHEKSYCYGGPYYTGDGPGGRPGDDVLRQLTWQWGCLAHESFGPWQVLFITAYEHGFRDDPIRLRDPMVSAEYLVKILNRRLFDKHPDATVERALDAWNSGNPYDANVPKEYVRDGLSYYLGHYSGGRP